MEVFIMHVARRVASVVFVTILCLSGCTSPPPPPSAPTDAQLAKLRQCESTGRYDAVSRSGTYRGAYQFDRQTWASVGGQGDPAAATPFEQDARARYLHAQRGWRPWPVCGRRV